MRRGRPRSLRARLTVAGFAFMLLPVAVLLAVVLATQEQVESETGAAVPGHDGVPEVTAGLSPWVVITAVLLLLPAALAAWWWAGRAVQPLQRITGLADAVQQGSLDRRIRLTGAAAEVQSLADSFDRMLDRLDEASANQRRLIEDTSHALRTPLAALAATTEVALNDPGHEPDDLRLAVDRAARLTARLRETVDSLLSDARAREGLTGQRDNDLMGIVRRVVDQQRLASPDRTIEIMGPDRLFLGIDGESVDRALTSLVENAVAHTPPGGPVLVRVAVEPGGVALSVTDDGPGIHHDDLDRVFERYRRGPDGGPSDRQGTGIGLALAKQVADAYGGITVVSPVGPAGGTRFTIRFASPTRGPHGEDPAAG